MKKLAAILAFCAAPAFAQTQSIVSESCTSNFSQCTLTDAAGDVFVVTGYVGAVSVAFPGQPAKSCLGSLSLVSSTTYRVIKDLTVSCDDGTMLTGTYTATRSGSGRGGWQWHYHLAYETVTLP